ncbi:hypothetical protein [Parapontixanthobacter aurantiacus]|uniref:hypothetical protein n=1 Tax=Parapontixanthobacter aurantiacus TaxID=1463599 RepID=UPI001928E5C4|nr:hypothetical protein [Parapontixanthobacter aurantiacus]
MPMAAAIAPTRPGVSDALGLTMKSAVIEPEKCNKSEVSDLLDLLVGLFGPENAK